MYSPFPTDGDDSRVASGRSIFKAAAALSGVAGAFLLVVGLSVYKPDFTGTNVAESTSLIGLSSSRFSARPSVIGRPSLASLPGPRPWKELAFAAMEAANSCERGGSVKAHARLKSVMASMDGPSKSLIAKASRDVAARALKVEEMPGVVAPLGFFDPLGLSTNLPEGKLLFYREVELKHGRLCMLAALGFLVGEQWHPLFGGDIDVPSYIAFQESPLEKFWIAVAAAIAIPEIQSIKTFVPLNDQRKGAEPYKDADTWTIRSDRISGDLGFDPLNLKPEDPAAFLELQNKELLNGRLAMISVAGMIAQELVTKQKLF